MDKSLVEKNKRKLKKLVLDGKWDEAKQSIDKFKTATEDKKDFMSKYAYSDFERLVEYYEKEKDQWLKDIQQSKYIDKELKGIISTALHDGYDSALSEIDEALVYSPTSANLYQIMYIIHFYKGDFEKYFEIKDSNKYQALYDLQDNISKLVEEENKYAQAIKLIDKHLEKYPEDHLMLSYKGVALYKQGEIEEAKAILKKSVASKRSRYAVYHLFEITKNKNETSEALVYADQLISIFEDEILEKESQIRKDDEKISVFDLWEPVHLHKVKFDKANILSSIGRTQDAIALLREIIDGLERKVYPKWRAASDEDPMYVVDAYQGGWDTPGTEMDKLYENTTSLLAQLDPSYRSQQVQNNRGGCLSVFVFIILTVGVVSLTIF